jgi:putative addiction module component (TIGR02574 family)
MIQFPLPPEIRSLPVSDRLDLVEQIWDSIAEDQEQLELSEEHKAELDRRLAAHEADPESGSTWEEVEQRLRNRG